MITKHVAIKYDGNVLLGSIISLNVEIDELKLQTTFGILNLTYYSCTLDKTAWRITGTDYLSLHYTNCRIELKDDNYNVIFSFDGYDGFDLDSLDFSVVKMFGTILSKHVTYNIYSSKIEVIVTVADTLDLM